MRQPRRRLAQVGPAGRLHAFDGAAVGRPFQVQAQDLRLVQVYFQLQRAQHLLGLAPWRARVRIEDARHLHGQGGAAGDDAALGQHLPARAQQRPRVDARMAPEPAVLVGQQRLQVQRRHAARVGRVTPHALPIGEGAQRRAVAGHHQGAGVAGSWQRRRERKVEHQQQRQHRHRAPAQPRQQGPQPAPQAPARRAHCRISTAPGSGAGGAHARSGAGGCRCAWCSARHPSSIRCSAGACGGTRPR